jgi:two-component system cell cycle sensor histidine kinase/response regulator CckA
MRVSLGDKSHKPESIPIRTIVPPSLNCPPVPRNVLVIDDDEFVRWVLVRFLERAGYTVFEAASGDQALKPENCYPRYDLAIIDYDMPGMDGIQTFAELQRTRADLRAILYTGHPVGETIKSKCPAGLIYQPKDFNPANLTSLVDQLMSDLSSSPAVEQKGV